MSKIKNKNVLISGASIAGLSAAWWMRKLGYAVTVVELAPAPRVWGAAIDIRENAIEAVKQMGLYNRLKTHALHVETMEHRNAEDQSMGLISISGEDDAPGEDIEIERDKFIGVLMDELKDGVTFLFNNSITALNETETHITATFKDGTEDTFDVVLGCDGAHSGVRKIWFGHEDEYSHFLEGYFSITTVNKLLIKEKAMQMFNVPGKAIILNAYNNKTDIIFCFHAEDEIPYGYRDTAQQKQIIADRFAGVSWRTAELLAEVQQSDNFYFDKFCQIKMPSWTSGRVALIGDAGYCASPAAGMGASLSIAGAAALAAALQQHNGNLAPAFHDYNRQLRPFIEKVQHMAEFNVKEEFIPRTEEAIRRRYTQ